MASEDEIHAEIINEELSKPDHGKDKPRRLGPLKWIIGLFLVLIIIAWVVPTYTIKLNPEPRDIPTISGVVYGLNLNNNLSANFTSRQDWKALVDPYDPIVKQIATRIAVQSCEGNQICHAKAVYYFVRDNIEYVSDPVRKDYVEYPTELLNSGGGDCESGAILLAALEEAIGVNAQLVFIPNHALVRIQLPKAPDTYKRNGWIYLDWTCSDCEFGKIPLSSLAERETYLDV